MKLRRVLFSAVVLAIFVLLIAVFDRPARQEIPVEAEAVEDVQQVEAPQPAEPVVKETAVSMGAVGDLLLHDDVILGGKTEDGYDFSNIFTWFAPHISALDYAAADMEGTLCSDDYGYPYAGYPCFNAPDEIVQAAGEAGFDLMLTANNHAYDTGPFGFNRTQEVIAAAGLAHIGTRQNADTPRWIVRDVGGIKVGMTCYTYSTGYSSAGTFSLNGAALDADSSSRVNAFTYDDLPSFYARLTDDLEAMQEEGAEASVVYMHWGDEYQTAQNAVQEEIAQKLCDLGVDVIVGNHPHVVQPVVCLQSGDQVTLCIYSTGNSVSNFFETEAFPPHTEDGVLFSWSFARYSDGTVLLEHADVLPTWVWRYTEDGVPKHRIVPLTDELGALGLDADATALCHASRARTEEIVADGLAAANELLAARQQVFEMEIKD